MFSRTEIQYLYLFIVLRMNYILKMKNNVVQFGDRGGYEQFQFGGDGGRIKFISSYTSW